jgi:hypothetical protein
MHAKGPSWSEHLDLDIQNKCLLSKWLFRRMNEDGVWQDPRNKYLRKIIIQVEHMSRDSQLWYGLRLKQTF